MTRILLCFVVFCKFSILFFFFKQKTAYEMRISDWSSDVCSSDLRSMPLMAAAADDLLARLDAADRSKPVDIDPMMTHVAADIIFRTLFSEALDERRSNIIHTAFGKFQRLAHSASLLRPYGPPARWLENGSLGPAQANPTASPP